MADGFFVARRPFVTRIGGREVVVRAGLHVTGDDPRYQANPDAFKPFVVDGGVEQATAAPGEKRHVRRVKDAG